jgi:hypothetical protein
MADGTQRYAFSRMEFGAAGELHQLPMDELSRAGTLVRLAVGPRVSEQ